MVANSPGLIAGSNVLHRLLMPRHPPCALHSLSQQRQDNTTKNNHRSTPNQRANQLSHIHRAPTPQDRRRCAAQKMLASTMQISNNNPTKQTQPTCVDEPPRREPEAPTNRLILQDPTVCLTPPTPTNPQQGQQGTRSSNVDDSTSEHHHACR